MLEKYRNRFFPKKAHSTDEFLGFISAIPPISPIESFRIIEKLYQNLSPVVHVDVTETLWRRRSKRMHVLFESYDSEHRRIVYSKRLPVESDPLINIAITMMEIGERIGNTRVELRNVKGFNLKPKIEFKQMLNNVLEHRIQDEQ